MQGGRTHIGFPAENIRMETNMIKRYVQPSLCENFFLQCTCVVCRNETPKLKLNRAQINPIKELPGHGFLTFFFPKFFLTILYIPNKTTWFSDFEPFEVHSQTMSTTWYTNVSNNVNGFQSRCETLYDDIYQQAIVHWEAVLWTNAWNRHFSACRLMRRVPVHICWLFKQSLNFN